MRDKKLAYNEQTNEWDIVFENGDQCFVDGDDALIQRLKIKLLFFSGEWFLNQNVGIIDIEEMGKKNPDESVISYRMKKEILEDSEVVEINKFSLTFSPQDRTARVYFSVKSIRGTISEVRM